MGKVPQASIYRYGERRVARSLGTDIGMARDVIAAWNNSDDANAGAATMTNGDGPDRGWGSS